MSEQRKPHPMADGDRLEIARLEQEVQRLREERDRLRKQNHDFASNYEKKKAPRMKELAEYRDLDKYVLDEVIGEMKFDPVTRVAINTYSIAQQAAVRNLVRDWKSLKSRNAALVEGLKERTEKACLLSVGCGSRNFDDPNDHTPECQQARALLKENEDGR